MLCQYSYTCDLRMTDLKVTDAEMSFGKTPHLEINDAGKLDPI